MSRTMAGLFDRLEDARTAYDELAALGCADELSLIARDPNDKNERNIIAGDVDEGTAFRGSCTRCIECPTVHILRLNNDDVWRSITDVSYSITVAVCLVCIRDCRTVVRRI